MLHACPDDERLAELARTGEDGDAPAPLAWTAHLASCARCRERLAEERRDARLLAELRAVAPRPGPPSVPGYVIECELDRGGQGVVYRAVQAATRRAVALKVLAGTLDGRARRRFEREVELGSRLAHPGIVTVYDGGTTGGVPWCALELVEGERLDAHVARTAASLERRLALFLELCAAVAHAHRSGVIHRDLKPANVLVDSAGRVRVLDFGTALPTDARRTSAPGEFLGTLAYASPEQVSGGSEACDTRTDVYSLGVVLCELAGGALPVDVDGPLSEVVRRIEHDEPRIPRGVDAELALVIGTALAKERERRYPSVDALARDVELMLAHQPLEARPRRAGYVLRKALRRHRGALALGVLGTLLAAGLGGAALREHLRAERTADDAALVRGVFEEVLGAAAPQRMGGDAPLREVLALAAREIETTLAGAPDARAAVQLVIGDTYRRLFVHDEAERHLRAALARFRAVDGDGLETARCLELLGEVLAAGTQPEAITMQEEALAIRRQLLDAGDPRIASSERALATALLAQVRDADLERAQALLDAAEARFAAALGPEDVEVAWTRVARARLAGWQGDRGAEALLVSALTTLEAHARAEPRDPRLADAVTQYGMLLQEHGRYDEAERQLERAEALTRELYGDELTSEVLRRRALVAAARGEPERAEELTRRALAFELSRWAGMRPAERGEIERVARALAPGGAADREPPYVEAFRILRRFRGDGAFELASWMNRIAEIVGPERAPLREALLREALEIRCRAYGEQCPVRQQTLLALGEMLAEAQRTDEAVPLLEQSLAIAEASGAEREVARVRAALACCRPGERP